jgi:hypothetical protein
VGFAQGHLAQVLMNTTLGIIASVYAVASTLLNFGYSFPNSLHFPSKRYRWYQPFHRVMFRKFVRIGRNLSIEFCDMQSSPEAEIFATTVPDPADVNAVIALRTYYVYVRAFSLLIPSDLRSAQQQLPVFQKLQRLSSIPTAIIEKNLFRGWLTLKAMELLPIDKYPEIATTANFWAPVQAYYALHGVGLACLAALNTTPPVDHRAFRASITEQLVIRLLPFPFNLWCDGLEADDKDCPCELGNCGISMAQVVSASNLENPSRYNAETIAAKALHTTRMKFLKEHFDTLRSKKVKPGKTRRNLKREEKLGAERNLHRTSIFDFIYRIRVRSNYDDPEMYIHGQTDADTAQRHYQQSDYGSGAKRFR